MKISCASAGISNPSYVKNLLQKMETREFVYLKQVMALGHSGIVAQGVHR